MSQEYCSNCGKLIRSYLHFGCPCKNPDGVTPNQKTAQQEQEVLEQRYRQALHDHSPDPQVLKTWETSLKASQAVINRPLAVVFQLLLTKEPYQNWYQRLQTGQCSFDEKKDPYRRETDQLFFPQYHHLIYFASLSMDGYGLWSYGNVGVILKEEHIEDRATLFEDNTLHWRRARRGTKTIDPGYRALWSDRTKLATIKHAAALKADLAEANFAGLMMVKGETTDGDVFIEVHIYDKIDWTAIQKVAIVSQALKPDEGETALKLTLFLEKLEALGIEKEVL